MYNNIQPAIPIIYSICVLLSVTLFVGYLRFVKEQHLWMKLVLVSVCFVNLGYFCLSVSPNLRCALISNSIAYLGNAFQPVLMFLTVANLCRVRIRKSAAAALLSLAFVLLLCACSAGILPIFYKTVEYTVSSGAVKLVKTYGIMHAVYTVYVFSFTLAVIIMTANAIFRKKLVFYRYIVMMVLIAMMNVLVWLVERFVRWNFEFLSVSYVLTTLLMVLLYAEISEHGLLDSFSSVLSQKNVNDCLHNSTNCDTKTSFSIESESLARLCRYYSDNKILSKRESEILALILQGFKKRDIGEKLFISENTIKAHRAKIYAKLEISSKEELVERINADMCKIQIKQ